MIEHQNLPFQDQHYLSSTQNISTLKDHIQSISQQDLKSLQGLLQAVEDTLSYHISEQETDELSAMKQKEREFRLFQELSRQNRQRSQNLTNMTQLTIHLLDYIQEQNHKNQQLQQHYQLTIQQLSHNIDQLTFRKITVQVSIKLQKNDVQSFKQELHRARNEIDHLLLQRQEQKDQQQIFKEHWQQKNMKIQLLEHQLEQLRSKLNFYKRSTLSKKQLKDKTTTNSLRYVYSESQFFPISMLQNQYQRLTQELSNSNKQIVQLQSPKIEVQLEKALKTVLSNKSLASSVYQRNNSGYLLSFNSRQDDQPNNMLSNEFHTLNTFDILPYNSSSQKVTFITQEDQSQDDRPQKDIFDVIGSSCLQTAVTIQQVNQNQVENTRIIEVKKMGQSYPKISKFEYKFDKVPTYNKISFVKKKSSYQERVTKDSQIQGLCSSLMKYLVKNRIKRTSSKANSGCPSY